MTPMSDDARQHLLAGIDFFSGCTDHQLAEISRLSEERSVASGAELCRQGDFENEVYVVVDGEADVIVDGRTSNKTRVGEILGELAMLGNGRRAATIRAVSPLRVLVLDPREIDSVLEADPSSARRLSQHGGED